MNKIEVSFDRVGFPSKPSGDAVSGISKRIGLSPKQLSPNEIRGFALDVSLDGHTFCPATFKNGSRNKANYEQQQFLSLDFDNKDQNKTISFDEVKARAEHYELPVLFAYDTFSSKNHDKFRVVFLNDNPLTDVRAAEMMLTGLTTIFPEADPSCKSAVQMYYGGGSELLYFDDSLPMVNIESVIRNTINCLEDRYKANHYKPHAEKFFREIGVSLNEQNQPDISVVDNPPESSGANNGKNLQSSIIYIPFSRFFPKRYYKINFGNSCTSTLSDETKKDYHRSYQSYELNKIASKCRLFHEFESGKRKLPHQELFGIATNMVQVQTGESRFKKILQKYSYYNQQNKYNKWNLDLRRINGYKPYYCDGFCPYHDTCPHGKNILSTAIPKRNQIEKLANYNPQLVGLDEAWEDFNGKFHKAVLSDERIWHVINCQTALGKTQAILELLKDTPLRVLIAVPTNKLKREVCERAQAMGVDIVVSPSLHELEDDLPDEVWDDIEALYDRGKSPMSRLNKAIAENDIECAKLFKQYKRELDEFNYSDGHAITTHRRLTGMDVSKYDLVLIDEDIIYSTVIPSKDDIPVSKLKKLKKKLATSDPLAAKIGRILKMIEKEEFFTLDEVDYSKAYADIKMAVNIPALCSASYFCYRKASDWENDLKEDCVSFIKPVKFQEDTKYIMLSATADKDVCEYCFGEENVKFYACKEASLTGTLNQFGDKSLARGPISQDTSIISKIKEWTGFEHTISFKKFLQHYNGGMYFGNCAGCDYLKGKDLDVIGTPHQPEWIYKLFAYSLGFDIEAKLKPNIPVTHNGCRFRFRTYDDMTLRAIQFYMIESELEQAVVRARLLRCGCTVNLFSNFPLRQVILRESEYDNE